MSDRLNKRLEAGAYAAVIVLSLVTSAVLMKRFLVGGVSSHPDSRVAAGTKVEVPGVDLSRGERTLVLALSSTCHFCTESAPFYRHLEQEASARGVRLVAVLPQTAEEGRRYMEKLGLQAEAVSVPLDSIGVAGTPTLIMLNRSGVVEKSWVGKLPEGEEADVLARLN